MAWTTPRDWTAGETVTAAMLNTHLRDNLNAIVTPASFTPTWGNTGTANSLGKGSISGSYITAGKLVIFRILLTWGSTTSSGSGNWTFTLPATAESFGGRMASAESFDSSAGQTYAGTTVNSTTAVIAPATLA